MHSHLSGQMKSTRGTKCVVLTMKGVQRGEGGIMFRSGKSHHVILELQDPNSANPNFVMTVVVS